jgi:superfamily II DNA or RNA helicase
MAYSKDNRGFWEYSIFQKIVIENEEENIKMSLKPENSFNPKLINDYINPTISREEKIIENKNNGLKISKVDNIIMENYIKNKNNDIAKDLEEIKNYGHNAKILTKEGKVHLMMSLLKNEISKNNIEKIANFYLVLKDPEYDLSKYPEYTDTINKMNIIVESVDLIKLQFEKFYSQMPPLNEKTFKRLNPWQIDIVKNIDERISTLVCATTSAGKSVLSGYTVTKGKILFVVPTDALAWQISSFLGGILNADIPIITLTYQSNPKRDQFIQKLNSSKAIVGTADCILDYLPLINCDFSWIIFDEIHMIGKSEGFAMESIAKILHDVPFLALSATIGNVEEVESWFKSISNKPVKTITCNKRFFNLQKHYYDPSSNDFVMLNPLSMVTETDFRNKSVKKKTMDPTPKDTWSLVLLLKQYKVDLMHLDPYEYFGKYERIELDKATQYFYDLINFMSDVWAYYSEEFSEIINHYSNINIGNEPVVLSKIIRKLTEENKTPAIIFQKNNIACLKLVRKLSALLDNEENEKYPNLYNDRISKQQKAKEHIKKSEKKEREKETTEKQLFKQMLEEKYKPEENIIDVEEINSPHPDFIFSKDKINDNLIKEYHSKFKSYFPNLDGDYHFLIRLLWRGIGVYAIGLPENYLRLIQSLANKKKLAIVFSDISLVFGISMPFKTSIIYHDETCPDNLDAMTYHQMAGRAGRRCLDKEGNVIFIGYSWERIKELSISTIPNVIGINKPIYTFTNGSILNSEVDFSLINTKLLNKQNNNEFISMVNRRIENQWVDTISDDYNHNHLMWMLRYSIDAVTINIIFPYIKKYFMSANPQSEQDQVELAFFMSKFIDIKYIDDTNNYLDKFMNNSTINYDEIYTKLRAKNININNNIDSRVWISIRNNLLVDPENDKLRQELFDFNTKLKAIQHYCFHSNFVTLTKLFGKLLTRIWWIYHSSSPIVRLI